MVAIREAEQAYTYAWWLTGEEASAGAAVHIALPQARGSNGDRLPSLLAGVRAAAIPERTMCPASEVALLHDGQGLALDLAAGIAQVELDDARTELAHGRLEALRETVSEPFAHPERLGGLAVGNPPDVAHARQCPSCAQASGLLTKGRAELRGLPRPVLPAELVAALAPAPPEAPTLDEPAAPPERDQPDENRRWRRAMAIAAAALAVAAAAWLLGAGAQPEPAPPVDASAEQAPRVAAPPADEPVVEPDAPAEPAGEFRVTGAALVGPDGRPLDDSALAPGAPLRLAVRYEGAAAGVILGARWSVDGALYRDLRVVLSGRRSTHVFGGEAPADGWPPGAHEVVLHVDGVVVAASHFTVTG